MSDHGSAEAALEALPQIASQAGVQKYDPCSVAAAEREMDEGARLGAQLLLFGEPDYPEMLYDLLDAPIALWALGDIALLKRPSLALIGARNASSLGTRMASSLARDIAAEGYVVTSGLARGVDTAAHIASLETGTIAIQAGGIDQIYPKENAALHDQIAEGGLRLSEQPIGMTPASRLFPKRNRIISGLSRAVVVVEAAAKSGSLHTARNALDQGREVLAVPGHPFDGRSAGCNMLIRDGAALVRSARDVIEALARPSQPEQVETQMEQPVHAHSLAHDQILGLLGPSPIAEDQLIRDLGLPSEVVSPQLMELELNGTITRAPGGLVSLAV